MEWELAIDTLPEPLRDRILAEVGQAAGHGGWRSLRAFHRRAVYRFAPEDGEPLVVKYQRSEWWRGPEERAGILESLRREVAVAAAAIRMGVATPECVLLAWGGGRWAGQEVVMVTPFIPEAVTLRQRMVDGGLLAGVVIPLVEGAGELLARIHVAGFAHGDYGLENVILDAHDRLWAIDWGKGERLPTHSWERRAGELTHMASRMVLMGLADASIARFFECYFAEYRGAEPPPPQGWSHQGIATACRLATSIVKRMPERRVSKNPLLRRFSHGGREWAFFFDQVPAAVLAELESGVALERAWPGCRVVGSWFGFFPFRVRQGWGMAKALSRLHVYCHPYVGLGVERVLGWEREYFVTRWPEEAVPVREVLSGERGVARRAAVIMGRQLARLNRFGVFLTRCVPEEWFWVAGSGARPGYPITRAPERFVIRSPVVPELEREQLRVVARMAGGGEVALMWSFLRGYWGGRA